MIAKRKLGERGQVVLPKDIREQFGLEYGSEILFEVRNDEIIMRSAADPDTMVDNFMKISRKKRKKINARWIKRTIEEQYGI